MPESGLSYAQLVPEDGCGSGVTSTCVTAATSSMVTSEHASLTVPLVADGVASLATAPAVVPALPSPVAVPPLSSPPHAARPTATVRTRIPTHFRIGAQCSDLPCPGAVAARLAPTST